MGKGSGIGSSEIGWASMVSRWKGKAGWISGRFSGVKKRQDRK